MKDACASFLEEPPSLVRKPLRVFDCENACAPPHQLLAATHYIKTLLLSFSGNPYAFRSAASLHLLSKAQRMTTNQSAPHSGTTELARPRPARDSVGQCMPKLDVVKRASRILCARSDEGSSPKLMSVRAA